MGNKTINNHPTPRLAKNIMRSLFVKIFLWFWLAMALVGLALFLSVATTQSGPVAARRAMVKVVFAMYAQASVEILERHGRPALSAFSERLEQTTSIHSFILDDDGHEIFGRVLPAGARELAAAAKRNGQIEFKTSDRATLVAQPTGTPHGDRYILIGEVPRELGGPLRRDSYALLRLVIVIMTGGIVCYGLARYLTAPIVKLRRATQQLAGGDLAARVGAVVGKRRDEVADLGRDFDLMAERIESLMTAQHRLLSDISHELRSPLARLNVALELARQRAGAEAMGALERIERESVRLNDLIGQLLRLSRLESGTDRAGKELVDLESLLSEIAADADFEARSSNRAVRIIRSEKCTMIGTAELLHRAIENIVRNAVRYTAEGTDVEITLACQSAGDQPQAVIGVRDHGPGVPDAALADLFRPFYRVADARDRQTGGTGLGLAITERAVRLHGGTITAANAPDGGLVVAIRLPAQRSKSEQPMASG